MLRTKGFRSGQLGYGINIFQALSKINCILKPDSNGTGGLYLGDITGA